MDEHQHRRRSRARRLADWRHPDAAGWLSFHCDLRTRQHPEWRRRLLSGCHGYRLASVGRRAVPHAMVQHRRIRRSRPGERTVPLRHRGAQLAYRAGDRQCRRLGQQALSVQGVVRRAPGRGLQPPEPPHLEPAGIATADAQFRRHQQHAAGLASNPVGCEVRFLRTIKAQGSRLRQNL